MAITPAAPCAAICAQCISAYSHLSRLSRLQTLWGAPSFQWETFQGELVAALDRMTEDRQIKISVLKVALRLAARSAALLSGGRGLTHCPYTQVSLSPPRLGLVGGNLIDMFCALHAAAETCGFPITTELPDDRDLSRSVEHLRSQSGMDMMMFEHGVIWLEQRRLLPDISNLSCAVVVAARKRVLIPSGMEVFSADDHRGGGAN